MCLGGVSIGGECEGKDVRDLCVMCVTVQALSVRNQSF